ncbi:MAG: hypothetical protein ABIG69_07665 [Bacteroidota bacterium]
MNLYHAKKAKSFLPHLIVFFVIFAFTLFVYIPAQEKEKTDFLLKHIAAKHDLSTPFGIFQVVVIPIYYAQFVVYLAFCIHLLIKVKKAIPNQRTFIYNYIFVFIAGMIFYETVVAASITFPVIDNEIIRIIEQITGIITIHFIGYTITRQAVTTIQYKLLYSANTLLKSQSNSPQSNHISEETKSKIKETVERYMKMNKPFLKPNFKLEQFSKKVHIPQKKLLFVINHVYGVNFSSFVNKYKIEEAVYLIKQNPNPDKPEKPKPKFQNLSRLFCRDKSQSSIKNLTNPEKPRNK